MLISIPIHRPPPRPPPKHTSTRTTPVSLSSNTHSPREDASNGGSGLGANKKYSADGNGRKKEAAKKLIHPHHQQSTGGERKQVATMMTAAPAAVAAAAAATTPATRQRRRRRRRRRRRPPTATATNHYDSNHHDDTQCRSHNITPCKAIATHRLRLGLLLTRVFVPDGFPKRSKKREPKQTSVHARHRQLGVQRG
jgi:hypothetical protein